jgi:hypothetical protein
VVRIREEDVARESEGDVAVVGDVLILLDDELVDKVGRCGKEVVEDDEEVLDTIRRPDPFRSNPPVPFTLVACLSSLTVL